MKFIKSIIILFLAFTFIGCGVIIRDSQNPILLLPPSTISTSTKIIINFSIPQASALMNQQFIGITFPPLIGSNYLQFNLPNSNNIPKYGCQLSNGVKSLSINAVLPNIGISNNNNVESNVAYCQLNQDIGLTSGIIYQLTLTINTSNISSQLIDYIGIFTSTTNRPDKIIIDSNMSFGSVGLYGDYVNYSSKIMEITSFSTSKNIIYPSSTFDLTVNIKCDGNLSIYNNLIAFIYPSNLVSPPINVQTASLSSTDPLQTSLQGTLSLVISSNLLIISGITENLVIGRQFQLIFRGFTALNNAVNTTQNLSLIVYYKNTYSIISQFNSPIFTIAQGTLIGSVNHPEYFDIYANGAWPMKFNFNSNASLLNGGFVLIQQTNTSENSSKFSMIASTCDFSENDSSFNQGFGTRPNCYPLRNDFLYPSFPSNSAYLGSGVFFKMPSISSTSSYFVTIWGFADICGTTYDATVTNNTTAYSQFQFQITIFGSISTSSFAESRLNYSGNPILAQSNVFTMGNKCWSAVSVAANSGLPTYINIKQTSGSPTPDITILKEFFEFYTTQVTSTTISTPTGIFAGTVGLYNTFSKSNTDFKPNYTEAYLYSSQNSIGANSYVFIATAIVGTPLNYVNTQAGVSFGAFAKISQLYAHPYVTGASFQRDGRLYVQFSRAFFVQGDSYNPNYSGARCFLTWHLNNGGAAAFAPVDALQLIYPQDTANKSNKIEASLVANAGNMDTTNTALPPNITSNTSSSTIYRIISVYDNFTNIKLTQTDFTQNSVNITGGNLVANLNYDSYHFSYTDFMFLTTCLKWTSSLPAIKSIFTYIDIQFSWITTTNPSSLSPVTKVNRFIKLFPQGGIFQDVSNLYKPTEYLSAGNLIPRLINSNHSGMFHTVYSVPTSSSMQNYNVCLLELSGTYLANAYDGNSNVLLIYLNGVSLIETEYNDLAATYPIAPIYPGIVPYSLSSANPMSSVNHYNMRYYSPVQYLWDRNMLNINVTANKRNFANASYSTVLDLNLVYLYYAPYATYFHINYYSSNNSAYLNNSNTIPRTMYFQYLSSIIALTGISSGSFSKNGTYQNVLIPYYCPVMAAFPSTTPTFVTEVIQQTVASTSNGIARVRASAVLQYVSMSNWSSISSINKTITNFTYIQNMGTTIFFVGFPVVNGNVTEYTFDPVLHFGYLYPYNSNTYSTATLKFTSYSINSTQLMNNLYIISGNSQTVGSNNKISAFALFLNSLKWDQNNLALSSSNTIFSTFATDLQKNFYINGKAFRKFIGSSIWGISIKDAVDVNYQSVWIYSIPTPLPNTSTLFFQGIIRPTIDFFQNNGNIVTTDVAAFFGIGYCLDPLNIIMPSCNCYITNYALASSIGTNTINNFILDFASDTTSNWTGIYFNFDNPNIFLSDPAGNFQFAFVLPSPVPIGSMVNLTSSSSLGINILCGMVPGLRLSSNSATSCTISNSIISCPVSSVSSSFYICCYNVLISNSINFSSATVTFTPNPNIVSLSSYLTTTVISAPIYTYNPFTYTPSGLTDILSTYSASIDEITYSQVQQEKGIGIATLRIILPRQAVRDLKLSISGDFSQMIYSGQLPRCLVSFNPPYDVVNQTDDILLESCSTSNISSVNNSILISTKKWIYKCNMLFDNVLFVSLWPIIVINWSNTSVATNLYTVSMNLSTGGDLIAYVKSYPMIFDGSLLSPPTAPPQWNTLCSVTNISPRIVGELVDFIFSIDLNSNSISLANTQPNEISLFLPNQYFQDSNIVYCYYQNSLVDCAYSYLGILNIRLSNSLPIGSISQILVSGLRLAYFQSNVYISCSVNNLQSQLSRTNLIIGSGLITAETLISKTYGGLIINNPITISDYNPRNLGTYNINLSFDTAIGLTNQVMTISNSPTMIFQFPDQYILATDKTNQPSIVVGLYSSNTNNVISLVNTISPSLTTTYGNKITAVFNNDMVFNQFFQYFSITIGNVIGKQYEGNTSYINIIITNSANSVVYRTYSNLNNYSLTPLTTNYDIFITNARGLQFSYLNGNLSKWVINVVTNDLLNIVPITPGRYISSSFNVILNSTNSPSQTLITLSDTLFKLLATSYTVHTSNYAPFGFSIGVPCGTLEGNYYVYFSISNTNNFYNMIPTLINISSTTTGIISFNNYLTTTAGGSIFIFYTLTEPTVDNLTINWQPNPSNDPLSAVISPNINVGTSSQTATFYSINQNIYFTQNFVTVNPNNCYSLSSNNLVINLIGNAAIIPPNAVLNSYFIPTTTATDQTLSLNSLEFMINIPYFPVDLYCALVCANNNFPSDSQIIGQNFTNTNQTLAYSNNIQSAGNYNLIFKGVSRTSTFKLRCIISSTQYDYNLRTSASVNVNITLNQTSLSAYPTYPQKCAQFTFNSDPGDNTKLQILYYCQQFFSNAGWASSGCIVCMDQFGRTAPGLNSTFDICNTRYLFQPAFNITGNQTSVNSTVNYLVCPIPDPGCSVDVPGGGYTAVFNQFLNNINTQSLFQQTLSIINVPSFTVNSLDDSIAPDITRVSIGNITFQSTGAFQFSYSSSTSYMCNFLLTIQSNSPNSTSSIFNCNDNTRCDSFQPTLIPNTYTMNNIRSFTPGNYYLYFACKNIIPYSNQVSSIGQASFSFVSTPNITTSISSNNSIPSNISQPNSSSNITQNNSVRKTILKINILIFLFLIFT